MHRWCSFTLQKNKPITNSLLDHDKDQGITELSHIHACTPHTLKSCMPTSRKSSWKAEASCFRAVFDFFCRSSTDWSILGLKKWLVSNKRSIITKHGKVDIYLVQVSKIWIIFTHLKPERPRENVQDMKEILADMNNHSSFALAVYRLFVENESVRST